MMRCTERSLKHDGTGKISKRTFITFIDYEHG